MYNKSWFLYKKGKTVLKKIITSTIVLFMISACAQQAEVTFYDKVFQIEKFVNEKKCKATYKCYVSEVIVHRVYLDTYVIESLNLQQRVIIDGSQETVQLTIEHDTKFFSWDRGKVFKGDWEVVNNLVDQVVYAK